MRSTANIRPIAPPAIRAAQRRGGVRGEESGGRSQGEGEAPPTCQDLRLVEDAALGGVGHQHVGQLLVAVLAPQQQNLVVPDDVRLVGAGSRRRLRNLVVGDLGLQDRRRSQKNGGLTAVYASGLRQHTFLTLADGPKPPLVDTLVAMETEACVSILTGFVWLNGGRGGSSPPSPDPEKPA